MAPAIISTMPSKKATMIINALLPMASAPLTQPYTATRSIGTISSQGATSGKIVLTSMLEMLVRFQAMEYIKNIKYSTIKKGDAADDSRGVSCFLP